MVKKLLGRVEIKELIEDRIGSLPERYSECRHSRVVGLEERDPSQFDANWTVQISAASDVCRQQVEAIVGDIMQDFDCNLDVDRVPNSFDDEIYAVSVRDNFRKVLELMEDRRSLEGALLEQLAASQRSYLEKRYHQSVRDSADVLSVLEKTRPSEESAGEAARSVAKIFRKWLEVRMLIAWKSPDER